MKPLAYLHLLTLALVCSSTASTTTTTASVLSDQRIDRDLDESTRTSHHHYDCSRDVLKTIEERITHWTCKPEALAASTSLSDLSAITQDQQSVLKNIHTLGVDDSQRQPQYQHRQRLRRPHTSPHRRAHNCLLARLFQRVKRFLSSQTTSTSTLSTYPRNHHVTSRPHRRNSHHNHHHRAHKHTPLTALTDAFFLNPGSLMLAGVALVFTLTALLSWAARLMADRVRYKPRAGRAERGVDGVVEKGTGRRGRDREDEGDEGWREKMSVVV